jgi:hypothetical protein
MPITFRVFLATPLSAGCCASYTAEVNHTLKDVGQTELRYAGFDLRELRLCISVPRVPGNQGWTYKSDRMLSMAGS